MRFCNRAILSFAKASLMSSNILLSLHNSTGQEYREAHPTFFPNPRRLNSVPVRYHASDGVITSAHAILRRAEGGKSGMIYVKSIVAGLICVCDIFLDVRSHRHLPVSCVPRGNWAYRTEFRFPCKPAELVLNGCDVSGGASFGNSAACAQSSPLPSAAMLCRCGLIS
jgi:hypothetical protein